MPQNDVERTSSGPLSGRRRIYSESRRLLSNLKSNPEEAEELAVPKRRLSRIATIIKEKTKETIVATKCSDVLLFAHLTEEELEHRNADIRRIAERLAEQQRLKDGEEQTITLMKRLEENSRLRLLELAAMAGKGEMTSKEYKEEVREALTTLRANLDPMAVEGHVCDVRDLLNRLRAEVDKFSFESPALQELQKSVMQVWSEIVWSDDCVQESSISTPEVQALKKNLNVKKGAAKSFPSRRKRTVTEDKQYYTSFQTKPLGCGQSKSSGLKATHETKQAEVASIDSELSDSDVSTSEADDVNDYLQPQSIQIPVMRNAQSPGDDRVSPLDAISAKITPTSRRSPFAASPVSIDSLRDVCANLKERLTPQTLDVAWKTPSPPMAPPAHTETVTSGSSIIHVVSETTQLVRPNTAAQQLTFNWLKSPRQPRPPSTNLRVTLQTPVVKSNGKTTLERVLYERQRRRLRDECVKPQLENMWNTYMEQAGKFKCRCCACEECLGFEVGLARSDNLAVRKRTADSCEKIRAELCFGSAHVAGWS